MFRVYSLPRTLAGWLATRTRGAQSPEAFYESKRLTAAFAVRRHPSRRRQGAKTVETIEYLVISALTLDTGAGACSALAGGRCSLYERRPLACRTLPFHYSRPEASAERDLEAFVATAGYGCETGGGAPVVLSGGRIVDRQALGTRRAALELCEQERSWHAALLRAVRTGSEAASLPSLSEIEANAAFGATTTSMRVAWEIAAGLGLIDAGRCRSLVAAQAALIERELVAGTAAPDSLATLAEMRSEYRHWLQ
jgi:Fe-S-cluster containining protein